MYQNLQEIMLTKFDRSFFFFFLNSGFCAFDFWIKKLNSNSVNLLSKLYSELDVFLIMMFGQEN